MFRISHLVNSSLVALRPNSLLVKGHSRYLSTYYTKSHEWITTSEDKTQGTIGITNYAQEAMGDIVFCEFEPEDEVITQGNSLGILESVKASSDVNMPISGMIIKTNPELVDQSYLINESPMDQGWLVKVNITNALELEGLLTEEEYQKLCQE